MKTKKEILQELLDGANETLIRIDITNSYLQNKYAENKNNHLLEELAKLEANRKENSEWAKFLEEQIQKA